MCKSMCEFTLILMIAQFVGTDSARILAAIPTPSISHQVVYRSYFKELARRGHEITIVTADPEFINGSAPDNLKEIDVHEISYKVWTETMHQISMGNKKYSVEQNKLFSDIINVLFEKQVRTEEFQNILKYNKHHYDLLILESLFRPLLILSHIFEAPVIQVSTFGAIFDNYDVYGAPNHPIYYPSVTRLKIYNLTIWDKIIELYNDWEMTSAYENHKKSENKLLKTVFGTNLPTITELGSNVRMLFVNTHPLFEDSQPIPPSVLHVWGIYKKPEKDLPHDLQSYLNSSKNGVIYMSFGTNADPSRLPQNQIQIFLKVFSKLPYDILWKWTRDELPGKSENIKIEKWFPQADLLKHPKIKLFITQGGLQSTDEAIIAGVPLIGIPMLGDQWYNTEKYKHLKIGEKLDFETLDEDLLRNTINKVITDESYCKNIAKLRNLLFDERESSLQKALWWTEYIIRHGGLHLRSPSANISNAEYFSVDLILILLLSLFVFLFSLCVMLYCTFKIVLRCIQSNKVKIL